LPSSATSTSSGARRDVRWVGLTPDERKARRRALLIDAGFDLLGTEGATGTTVRAVCHKAELNARYFYESFEDIDALLVAVYDHVVEQLGVALVTAPPEKGTHFELARAGMARLVEFIDEDRRRARILYIEAHGNTTLNRHRRETDIAAITTLEQAAVEAAGSWPTGERVGLIGASMLIGGLSEVLLDWIDGRIDVTRDQLVDDLAALALALGETTEKIARKRVLRRVPRS
jgi:AcrR family transcriptional regulator